MYFHNENKYLGTYMEGVFGGEGEATIPLLWRRSLFMEFQTVKNTNDK